MAVYGDDSFDGRVQRSANAVSQKYELKLFSFNGLNTYPASNPINKYHSLGIFNWLRFNLKFALAVLHTRPHILYLHDYHLAMPGLLLGKVFARYVIYDSHELFVTDQTHPLALRERIMASLESLVINHMDLVICASTERLGLMKSHYHIARPFIVVENKPIWSENESSLKECHKVKNRNDNDFLIVYQGNLDNKRRLSEFIKSFEHLPNRFKLALAGQGKEVEYFKKEVTEAGLKDRVTFFNPLPNNIILPFIKQFHLGLVGYAEDGLLPLNVRYCASTKIHEYILAGIPVVSTAQVPLKTFIEEHGVGYSIDMEYADSGAVVRAIANAIQDIALNYRRFKDAVQKCKCQSDWGPEANNLMRAINELAI